MNHSLTIFAVAMFVFGCAHSPRLSETRAVAVATDAARAWGFRSSEFGPPKVELHTDGVWFVSYDTLAPGGDWLITVEDRTGVTRVMRGE